ncbi:MAG: toll/interleukin-1 receptor domain-containing protein [Halioglobus sp.]
MADYKYKAFISYSHHDVTVARWLHRALEAYRPPRDAGSHASSSAQISAFPLRPIFRDEDELVVSANLSDSLVEALQQSEFLIVICSPSSVSSKWASQEIIEFKKNRGASNVIAVIADGDPENCFPEPLLREVLPSGELGASSMEPLAADLQGGRTARRLALLKVAASMLGVGLDQLVQREAQRRNRFLATVATAAVFGMLVMGWLTFTAVNERQAADAARLIAEQSRQIAEQRRQEAEGLIEFMLGDLREKLQPVGRLDVLDAVGSRALDYYANQDQQSLGADSLGRRARALILLGEISDTKGDVSTALEQFTLAAESTALLLEAEPLNTQRIFDHAQSVFWVGYVAYQQGGLNLAREQLGEYFRLAKQLVAIDGPKPKWLEEVSSGYLNLGAIAMEEGQLDLAETYFLGAIEELNVLKGLGVPGHDQSASIHSWLASVYLKQKKFALALAYNRKEIDSWDEHLAVSPEDHSAKWELLATRRRSAQLTLVEGDVNRVLDPMLTLMKDMKTLEAYEPENKYLYEQRVMLTRDLAEVRILQNELSLAQERSQQCIDQSEALVQLDDTSMLWRIELGWSCRYLAGSTALKQEKVDVAHEWVDSFYDDLLVEHQGATENDGLVLLLGNSSLLSGDIFDAKGEGDKALQRWRYAETILQGDERILTSAHITTLIATQQRLGEKAEADALIAYLNGLGYKHPGFVALQD